MIYRGEGIAGPQLALVTVQQGSTEYMDGMDYHNAHEYH
jgi:hypothetical protein